jgi:hypothetical protein
LKQILSLPQNVADPVPYIISGLIPIEGQIHLKILTFMYNIFLLSEDSTEKKRARRQLAFKDVNSNSWFTEVKSMLWKYDLPEIYWLLESPYTKYQWKKLLYEQVNIYWKNYMIETSKLYKSIDFLNTEIYKPGKQHPLIYIKTVSTRDANRNPIKLKVVSGQYILQANRARFNQNQVDTICQLCGEKGCTSLLRQPVIPTTHYSDSPFLRHVIPSKMVKSNLIILKPVVLLLYLTED